MIARLPGLIAFLSGLGLEAFEADQATPDVWLIVVGGVLMALPFVSDWVVTLARRMGRDDKS
jgi:uncharacterized membrane protein